MSSEYEPIIYFYTENSEFINSNFLPNSIRIPSFRIGTSILRLSRSNTAPHGTYTVFLIANSTLQSSQSEIDIYPESFKDTISTSIITVTVLPALSFVDRYGGIISTIALIAFLLIPTVLSLKASFLTRRLPDLISITNIDILHVNAAIIAGVLHTIVFNIL